MVLNLDSPKSPSQLAHTVKRAKARYRRLRNMKISGRATHTQVETARLRLVCAKLAHRNETVVIPTLRWLDDSQSNFPPEFWDMVID